MHIIALLLRLGTATLILSRLLFLFFPLAVLLYCIKPFPQLVIIETQILGEPLDRGSCLSGQVSMLDSGFAFEGVVCMSECSVLL